MPSLCKCRISRIVKLETTNEFVKVNTGTKNRLNPLDASPRTLYVVIFELPYASPRTAYVVVWNKKSENIPWAETFETSPAWRSKHVVKPILPLIMCNVKLSRYLFLFEGVCCKTSFIVYFKKNENLFVFSFKIH